MTISFHRLVYSACFLLIPATINAQSSSEEWLKKASKHYEEGQFMASAKAYDRALLNGQGSAVDYYNAACSWALTQDTIHSMAYLRRAMEAGWKNADHLEKDVDLAYLRGREGWDEVVGMARDNLAEYEKDFDQALKTKLEEIYVRDQTLRQLYREAEEKFGEDSDEMDYFRALMNREDRANENEVMAILDERGWVGMSTVGGKANIALFLVVQHAPLEVQEKYLPLMEESVEQGESSGRHLAMLQDRVLMRTGKPQVFGSQVVRNPETGKEELYELSDPEKVNERRAAIGLGPLEEYLARFGIEWNPEK